MSKEMLHRIRTAGEYHRKAIYALFPEKMSGHLGVIEKEIRLMLLEMAEDALKGCKKQERREEKPDSEKPSGARRVDIL